MLRVSQDYKNAIKDHCALIGKVNIRLSNGASITIDDDLILSLNIEEAVSDSDSFGIGAAIISKCTVQIYNDKDVALERYDFRRARITPLIGAVLTDGEVEWLERGVFTVEDVLSADQGITLEALDDMANLDYVYEPGITYPATLRDIVSDICRQANIPYTQTSFYNSAYVVDAPQGENLTYRLILAHVAQLAGSFVRIDSTGHLVIAWFNGSGADVIADGGSFDHFGDFTYMTGFSLDGGDFTDYATGNIFDAGVFSNMAQTGYIEDVTSQSIGENGYTITGIMATTGSNVEDEGTDENKSYIVGDEGYVINVSGNGFISEKNVNELLLILAEKLIGFNFHPFSVSSFNIPYFEAGDLTVVIDRTGKGYASALTNLSLSLSQSATYVCGAQNESENDAQRPTQIEMAKAELREQTNKKVKHEIRQYDKAVQELTALMTQSLGAFKTESVDTTTEATIYYMHNKPNLKDSTTIWKMTADGLAVSTNGGVTWNAGIDSQGRATVNMLSAVGISFDWAQGGTLTLGGEGNQSGAMTIKNADGKEIVKLNNGGINLASGASLVSESGVCGNLQYVSNGGSASPLGAMNNGGTISNANLYISVYVPDNYVVKSAKLTLISAPGYWDNYSTGTTIKGYSRGINLNYGADAGITLIGAQNGGYTQAPENFEPVTGTRAGGFSSKPNGASSDTKQISSGDLASLLTPGKITTFCISATMPTSMNSIWAYTGAGLAILNVIGYTKN